MGTCSLQNSILMQFCITFASRLKTTIFVVPEGLCTCSNYKKFFIKSNTDRTKKGIPDGAPQFGPKIGLQTFYRSAEIPQDARRRPITPPNTP